MRPVIFVYLASLLLAGCSTSQPPLQTELEAPPSKPQAPLTLPTFTPPLTGLTIEEALEDARLLILADQTPFMDYSKQLIETRYKGRLFWEELNVVVSMMSFRHATSAYGVALKKDDGWHVLIQTDTPTSKLPKPDKLYYVKELVGRGAIWRPADNEGRPIR